MEDKKLRNEHQLHQMETVNAENQSPNLSETTLKGISNPELYNKDEILEDNHPYEDEVIGLIGDGKRWQIIITIVLSLCGLCPEFSNILAVQVFFSPTGLFYYCNQHPRFANWTIKKWMSLSHYNGSDPCKIYDLDYNSIPMNYFPNISTPTVDCNKTIFSHHYGYTLTEKWKMVCKRKHLIPTYQYLLFFGKILGNIIFGIWCDRRGRRNLLILCILTQPVFALMITSTSSYIIYVIGLSFLGVFLGGAFVLSLIYVVEVLGPKTGTIFMTLAFLSAGLSSFCLAFVHFALPRWHHMQLFISVPVIIILVWLKVFEESPRWLLVMLRTEDALSVMKVIAHRNNITLPPKLKLQSVPQMFIQHVVWFWNFPVFICWSTMRVHEIGLVGEEDDDRYCNIWDVRNYPNLRTLVILLIFLHYGLSSIQQVRVFRFRILLSGLSIQAGVMGTIEIISVVGTVFLLLRFGHSKVTSVSMILYGILNLFLLIFVHGIEDEDYFMTSILAIITYFLVTIAYVSSCVYSCRILPTIIRGSGIGILCAAYNCGVMLIIFISRSSVSDVKVFIISMSMLSLIVALVAYVLPEAIDRELPDTLRDGEHYQRRPRPRRWIAQEDVEVVEKELTSVLLHQSNPTL